MRLSIFRLNSITSKWTLLRSPPTSFSTTDRVRLGHLCFGYVRVSGTAGQAEQSPVFSIAYMSQCILGDTAYRDNLRTKKALRSSQISTPKVTQRSYRRN